MSTKHIIAKLKHGSLSQEESLQFIQHLTKNEVSDEQKVAALVLLESRLATVNEMRSFSLYLLEHCIVPFKYDDSLMDVCGTGGDGKSTINISTLNAIILAAAGVKIAKHGNYGVTSANGSSNILECLGYNFKQDGESLKRELDEWNITFLHAPFFHPVLKAVSSMRKNLKEKTVFNVLGPMINPLRPEFRYTGVSNPTMARNYHYCYQELNCKYKIVYSTDGNDEITLTSMVKIYSNQGEELNSPFHYGSNGITMDQLLVGHSIEEAARRFLAVLKNEENKEVLKVVLTNSAEAYRLRFPEVDFQQAYLTCEEVLVNGSAYNLFKKLIA